MAYDGGPHPNPLPPPKGRNRRKKKMNLDVRKNVMRLAFCLGAGLFMGGMMTGCRTVTDPETRVLSATLAEETEEGARVVVTVELVSKNKVALPLTDVHYEGTVSKVGDYSGKDRPNRTIPIKGRQTIEIPYVFKTDELVSGRDMSVSGDITYEPPGQIRKLLTESGVPLPSTAFYGRVKIDASPATQPALPFAPAPGL
jgi:LEA14-like dessication related protein